MGISEIRKDIGNELEKLKENEISWELGQKVNSFDDLWQTLPEDKKQDELQKAVDIIDKNKYLSAVYMYSLFTFRIHDKKWMEEMLEVILSIQNLGADTLHFLYWQIFERFMLYPECESENGKVLHWKLFQRTCEKYAEGKTLKWVNETQRNKDLVVVIMTQY